MVQPKAVKLVRHRVFAVYMLAGAVLGAFSAVSQTWMSLPRFLEVGFFAGALVLLAPLLNWLVRSGKARWLIRE